MIGRISRRNMLALLAGVGGTALLPASAEEDKTSDRGIGGTGIMSGDVEGGRAVGFIGTIQRFGSIYVNDTRITYPPDVEVRVDGVRHDASALALGQVVSTVATAGPKDRLTASRIMVVSEVIGPIEAISGDNLKILGQNILISKRAGRDGLEVGARMAVSGLRTAEGIIIASRIEPAGTRPDQVVGTPTMHGWTLRIGELQLIGLGENYEGWRVIVQGVAGDRGLRVQRARVDTPFAGASIGRASIEAYVEQSGGALRIGPGAELRGLPLSTNLGGQNVRAVLDIGIEASGAMRLESLSTETRQSQSLGGRGFGLRPIISGNGSSGISFSQSQGSASQMKGASGIGLAGQGSLGTGSSGMPSGFGTGGSFGSGGDGGFGNGGPGGGRFGR